MERLGLILVLFLVGLFAIFSGDLQLGGAEVPTWLVLEGPFARVFGVLMIGIAGWLVYREFRRDKRPRTKGAQATPGERRDVQPSPEQRFLRLTEDDRRFLGLLAEDLPDEEVANRLGMPGLDINMMALSLCGKLGVKSKAELIQQAREMGLLAPDTKDEIPSPEQQKVTTSEERRQKLDELQEKHGAVLPTEYASFLLENEGGGDVELDGGFWMMASLLPTGWVGVQPLTLDSDFSLDMLPPVPFFRALGMFIQAVGDRFPKAEVTSLDGEPFSFDRLRSATCIGEDNGDILFIDAISQGVYAFYHDDFGIQKIADSFGDFMGQVE